MEEIMDENLKICNNCAHYRRHYVLGRERCTPVNCGHCSYPRIKRREPDNPACEHFEYRDHSGDLPDRQGVISYLTTEFLRDVLAKQLPPVIEGDEGFD